MLERYKKAFSGFSNEEMSLDGVILEPPAEQMQLWRYAEMLTIDQRLYWLTERHEPLTQTGQTIRGTVPKVDRNGRKTRRLNVLKQAQSTRIFFRLSR